MPFQCADEDGIFIIRAKGVIRIEEVEALGAEEERYFATPGCKGLFLCDFAELKVISPDGADALVGRMKHDNPRVSRSAFVVTEGTTAALQLTRMIRDAGSAHRALFVSETQAWAWLRLPS
jgi:hypothetical protein